MDFFLEDKISEKEHDDKRAQLITRREKIMDELDAHNNADDSFNDTIIDVLNLASNAHEIFRLSTTEKKRKLINLVLSTVKLNGQKLEYTLRSPFDAFVNLGKKEKWWDREDSNLRPSD